MQEISSSALARDRKNLMGANRFAMWAVALQKRDARTSPCSELAPNGKVARLAKVALMAFSAATSGQIVVPAPRLFVYSLRGSAESYRKASRDTNHSISVQCLSVYPRMIATFSLLPGMNSCSGHIQYPNTIITRRNAVLLAF